MMKLIPLGIGAAFCEGPYGYCCNLVDDLMLIDAAPDVVPKFRELGFSADSLRVLLITHLHPDHVFGFPFLLAGRSPAAGKLIVVGPKGTEEKLTRLCEMGFSTSDPGMAEFIELPTGEESEIAVAGYHFRSFTVRHSEESLGYLITSPEGYRLAYSGDTALFKGLGARIMEADMAVLEMTFLEEESDEHLSLTLDMPEILNAVRPGTKIVLTHLGYSREMYEQMLKKMANDLPSDKVEILKNVEVADELNTIKLD